MSLPLPWPPQPQDPEAAPRLADGALADPGDADAFAHSLRLIHLQKLERASLRSRKEQVCA